MCIKKLIFLRKRPKVIIVGGVDSSLTVEAIFQVLKKFFRVKKIEEKLKFKDVLKNDILIFEATGPVRSPHRRCGRWLSRPTSNGTGKSFSKKFKFWLKNSSLPILVISSLGEIPPLELESLAQLLPSFSYLILNFDDETVRSMGDKLNVNQLNFGLDKGADFQVIDLRISKDGTNFKLNFGGNILPVWLRNLFGKKNVYSVLAALCVGYALNLNLVKLSQQLEGYQGVDENGVNSIF